MVKQSSKKASSNLYDRLSRTDTYASRGLKEKVLKAKESGRPLFKIELEMEASWTHDRIPKIKPTSSGSTVSTCSTTLSGGLSKSSQRVTGRNKNKSQSIYERLASTGTKSSLRKHKQSAIYANDDDTIAESMKKFHCRDFGSKKEKMNPPIKRNTLGMDNVSFFFVNQNEAEI